MSLDAHSRLKQWFPKFYLTIASLHQAEPRPSDAGIAVWILYFAYWNFLEGVHDAYILDQFSMLQ